VKCKDEVMLYFVSLKEGSYTFWMSNDLRRGWGYDSIAAVLNSLAYGVNDEVKLYFEPTFTVLWDALTRSVVW
jgi:hypothetical protein